MVNYTPTAKAYSNMPYIGAPIQSVSPNLLPISGGRAVVARASHKHQVAGANPAPRTISSIEAVASHRGVVQSASISASKPDDLGSSPNPSATNGHIHPSLRHSYLNKHIHPNDQVYVDFIIRRESSWNYMAVNAETGAYGLFQSVPSHWQDTWPENFKIDPDVQFDWAKWYMAESYGSWEAARAHWEEKNWW